VPFLFAWFYMAFYGVFARFSTLNKRSSKTPQKCTVRGKSMTKAVPTTQAARKMDQAKHPAAPMRARGPTGERAAPRVACTK
jgi:hypothetical protein